MLMILWLKRALARALETGLAQREQRLFRPRWLMPLRMQREAPFRLAPSPFNHAVGPVHPSAGELPSSGDNIREAMSAAAVHRAWQPAGRGEPQGSLPRWTLPPDTMSLTKEQLDLLRSIKAEKKPLALGALSPTGKDALKNEPLLDKLKQNMPLSANSWCDGAEQAGKTVSWLRILYCFLTAAETDAYMPPGVCLQYLGVPLHVLRQTAAQNVEMMERLLALSDFVRTRKGEGVRFDAAAVAALDSDRDAGSLVQNAMTMVLTLERAMSPTTQ